MKSVCYLIDMIVFHANSIEGLTYEPIQFAIYTKALDITEILPCFYPTCSIYSPFSITQGEPEAARMY